MYQLMNEKFAMKYGMTAAFVAALIWDGITLTESNFVHYRNGRFWFRGSYKVIAAIYPFLTRDMVRGAMKKLMRQMLYSSR